MDAGPSRSRPVVTLRVSACLLMGKCFSSLSVGSRLLDQ